MAEIAALFDQYEWAAEVVEPGIWRAGFTTERDLEYDLYVMAAEGVVRFAVTPFVTRPDPACEGRIGALLLKLNPQIPYAYFGVDGDGDLMLMADLPASLLNFDSFATVVDTLAQVTDALAYEIGRVAHEPGYHSALLSES
ncbi:MAG: hypothetical protein IT329_19485 [Caldilineaceae bacterium]|nr:hypothetical protein [Caldilineaceae bacterium]